MKKLLFIVVIVITLFSCNSEKHRHDGSYSLNIQVFGTNINSQVDMIIDGDKMKYNEKIYACKQYSDRVDVENGRLIFTAVDGDLITNVPTLGKLRYIRVSGDRSIE